MIYSCLEFSTAIGNRGVNRGSLEGIMLGLVAEAGNGGLLTTLRFRLVLAPVNLQRIWASKEFRVAEAASWEGRRVVGRVAYGVPLISSEVRLRFLAAEFGWQNLVSNEWKCHRCLGNKRQISDSGGLRIDCLLDDVQDNLTRNRSALFRRL